jgi:hypothetical protein
MDTIGRGLAGMVFVGLALARRIGEASAVRRVTGGR